MPDFLLYVSQFASAALLSAVLEHVFHRSYEPDFTWAVVVWGVAQVGLLVALRLWLWGAPPDLSAVQAAWWCWWIIFWSFVAAALPVIGWQLWIGRGRLRTLMAYYGDQD